MPRRRDRLTPAQRAHTQRVKARMWAQSAIAAPGRINRAWMRANLERDAQAVSGVTGTTIADGWGGVDADFDDDDVRIALD